MTYRGRVTKGQIVLDEPQALPEGTEVLVQPVAQQQAAPSAGWPPGFIEGMAGSISDETFFRHPQGEYEGRAPPGMIYLLDTNAYVDCLIASLGNRCS